MTYATLKTLVASYFEKVPADFSTLLEEAIRSARVKAEQSHDFQYSKVVATLAIASASTGAAITSAQYNAGAVNIKRIRHVLLPLTGGEYLPCEFMMHDDFISRQRQAIGRAAYTPGNTLAQYGVATENPIAYMEGNVLKLYPASQFPGAVTVRLAIVRYLPDYSGNSDTDFIMDNGAKYMLWQSIIETNKLWRRFAPRQEGNLDESALQDLADEAFAALIQWDAGLSAGSSNPVIRSEK